MSPFAIAASFYARHGLPVFPLRPRSKEPATAHGFKDATTDLQEIARMARRYPQANIGIACAAGGLVVIDTDDRSGGSETFDDLVQQLGPLPESWVTCTPGGMHRYFRAPAAVRFRGSLGAGIDVKHEGYVVAPPSVHPSGRVYAWEASSRFDELPLADVPAVWLTAMTERPRARVLQSSVTDARESYLGRCFEILGWLGEALSDGRRCARCPWLGEHTDARGAGDDSSTVLFPKAENATLGGFRCLHGHCAARTWRDVLDAMPLRVRASAARAVRVERTRILRAQVAPKVSHG